MKDLFSLNSKLWVLNINSFYNQVLLQSGQMNQYIVDSINSFKYFNYN